LFPSVAGFCTPFSLSLFSLVYLSLVPRRLRGLVLLDFKIKSGYRDIFGGRTIHICPGLRFCFFQGDDALAVSVCVEVDEKKRLDEMHRSTIKTQIHVLMVV
jgi:hypothetical protein